MVNRFGVKNVPGHVLLPVDDYPATVAFLRRELLHDRLNSIAPIFWLVATQQSSNISPLHHQYVRGRQVVITEDPGLHLLWYGDKVYIKPLPPYLTNHAFWKQYLSGKDPASLDLRKAALGYVRSYFYLIQHRSDFDIAVEKRLIHTTDFGDLLYFLQSFRDINDHDVTPRYRYGQLRLSRLNFYYRFCRFRLFYHEVNWHYGTFISQVVAPFVFVFAVASVALAAMQVVLAVEQLGTGTTTSWNAFISVARWFSVVCLFLALGCIVIIPPVLSFFLFRELFYVIKYARRQPSKP